MESPDGRFDPFIVHYAETFIVPAPAGQYTIRPSARTQRELGTIKPMRDTPVSIIYPTPCRPPPQGGISDYEDSNYAILYCSENRHRSQRPCSFQRFLPLTVQ